MEWARTSDGKESDLGHLLQFLQLEIARRDRSQVYTELTKQGRLTAATSGGHSAGGATRQGGPARQDRPAAAATSGRRPAAAAAQLQLISESCSYCGQPDSTAKCRGLGGSHSQGAAWYCEGAPTVLLLFEGRSPGLLL